MGKRLPASRPVSTWKMQALKHTHPTVMIRCVQLVHNVTTLCTCIESPLGLKAAFRKSARPEFQHGTLANLYALGPKLQALHSRHHLKSKTCHGLHLSYEFWISVACLRFTGQNIPGRCSLNRRLQALHRQPKGIKGETIPVVRRWSLPEKAA